MTRSPYRGDCLRIDSRGPVLPEREPVVDDEPPPVARLLTTTESALRSSLVELCVSYR